MRLWIRLGVVIGLLGFVAPVARSEVYMDYDFTDGVVWEAGNFEAYDILRRGEVVGEARVEYSRITMQDLPVFRLEWSQSWTVGEEESHEIEIDSKMFAADLRVVMASRVETIGDEEWRFEGNYSGENVNIGSYYPGDPERYEYSVTRHSRFCDSDSLPFLLRNIPFEDGNFITFTVLDLSMQAFFTPIAKVAGSELVETSRTQYDCWVVNVSTSSGSFTAWYSKSEPHYLVQIRYYDRDVVLNHHS